MRIVKKADERKNEILDAVEILFAERGVENTSTSDILEKVGIARGTLYHHFKSKEEIMDAWLNRITERSLEKAEQVANDTSLPVVERFLATVSALQLQHTGNAILEYLHKPQNALIHQKAQRKLLLQVPPILSRIVREGIAQGIFDTPYPEEAVEMLILYASAVLDDDSLGLTFEAKTAKTKAFFYHVERLLGAEKNAFADLKKLIPRQ